MVHLATSKRIEKITGEYFVDCNVFPMPGLAQNIDFSKKIWDASEKYVQLSQEEKIPWHTDLELRCFYHCQSVREHQEIYCPKQLIMKLADSFFYCKRFEICMKINCIMSVNNGGFEQCI